MNSYKDVTNVGRWKLAVLKNRLRRAVLKGSVITLAILSFAGPVKGQTDKLPSMKTTVRAVREDVQRVSLFVNRTAVIDSNIPIEKMQVVSADIATVDSLAPNQILVTGRMLGSTHLILTAPDGQKQVVQIDVAPEIDKLQDAIARIAPHAKVVPHVIGTTVMLTGTVGDPHDAENILEIANTLAGNVRNYIRVAGEQQVLLRTTIAEVDKSSVRRLGVNGFFGGDDFRDFFLVNQIDSINPINIGAAANQNLVGQLQFLTGKDGIPLQDNVTLSLGFPRVEMQLFVEALRENGLLRVLAEPNLTAISGKTATFLAGGEFPIPVPQNSGGGTTITIEYREFGVRLNFTPTYLGGQMIRLRIEPEVSELDFSAAVTVSGTSVPGLTQRRVETTVEIGAGQTLAIAGLLSEQSRGLVRRVPGLGDVPVLGSLFSSSEYRNNATDLVILVTPQIISPVNPDQVPPVPGEYMTTPNDWQFFGLGLLEGDPAGHPYDPVKSLKTETPVRTTPAMLMHEADKLSLHGPWGPADFEEAK